MIKSFFKDNPIHKRIAPYLDFIFLFAPTNYFFVWGPVCLGMYIANTQSGLSGLWISVFNLKVGFLFLALSLQPFRQTKLSDLYCGHRHYQ